MVNIPNPFYCITDPLKGAAKECCDKLVGSLILGGAKRAAKNIGGDFLASLSKGVDNIGQFSGNHKKELALGAGATLALGLTKQLFWPSHAPAPPPPPPPTLLDNVVKFSSLVKDNWQIATPVAGLLGAGVPLLMRSLSEGRKTQQDPQALLRSIMQNSLSNIQSGDTGSGKPFLGFDNTAKDKTDRARAVELIQQHLLRIQGL